MRINYSCKGGINMTDNEVKIAKTDDVDINAEEAKAVKDLIDKELVHDPVDGSFEIETTSNFSKASLKLTSAHFGGKFITAENVDKELKARGIVFGIDLNEIVRMVQKGVYGEFHPIAKWTPPEDGIDGTLTYHFEKTVETKPKEGEDGFVDYKDLGIIRNIHAGTNIGTITLPTEGTPGTDIRNTIVQQKRGVAVNVSYGDNIGLSGDGTKLLALCDGNLKYSGNKFSIDTVFNMRGNVDVATGNLEFIGDIVIRGEVMEGFKVTSNKNITIYENAVGAAIEAGGNVIIKKGCINATVIAHGSFSGDFVENSKITCDGDCKADAFITSNVHCGGELIATGKRGLLMGGKYTSLKNLTANSIGTKSYATTIVTVGDNAIMLEEKESCEKKVKEITKKMDEFTLAVDFLHAKQKEGRLAPEREELLTSVVKMRIVANSERSKVQARINEIVKYLENKQNLSITCKKEMYPGTKITINDFVLLVNDKYQYCKIYLSDDGIKTETL